MKDYNKDIADIFAKNKEEYINRLENLNKEYFQKADSKYIEVLEKTNNSLNVSSSPYGIMVGFLSVMFTILTIIAAGIVWWQSRENKKIVKDQLSELIEKQKKIMEEHQEAKLEEVRKKILEIGDQVEKATDENIKKNLIDQENILKDKEKSLSYDISKNIYASMVNLETTSYSSCLKIEDLLCGDCITKRGGYSSGRNTYYPNPYIFYKPMNYFSKTCLDCRNNIK